MNSETFSAPPRPFQQSFLLRFHECDPAGIMFFGNVYALAHNAYEDFLVHLGFDLKHWFGNPDWGVPVRKSSCEYFSPLWGSRTYRVLVEVALIGTTSFTMKYSFYGPGGKNADDSFKTLHCQAELVHTFLDLKKRVKMELPLEVRRRLEVYQAECLAAK